MPEQPAATDGAHAPVPRRQGEVPGRIVFFRLGDFYEMFFEDAVYAARVLDLTLTTRDKGKEDPIPMCGIPHHAVRPYLVKLTELGHRVALCEQLEDPRAVRGIVKRERGPRRHARRHAGRGVAGSARAQLRRRGGRRRARRLRTRDPGRHTGDFRATEARRARRCSRRWPGRAARARVRARRRRQGARRAGARRPRGHPAHDGRAAARRAELGARARRGPAALGATGRRARARRRRAVLRYARATQPGVRRCRSRALDIYRATDTLIIDEQARRHLELTESLLDGRRAGSLIEVLDERPHRDGRAAAAPLAAVPVGRRGGNPPPPRRGRAAGRRARRARRARRRARRRSPTSSAWSDARASAWRRRAIWRCSGARSRGCRAARGARDAEAARDRRLARRRREPAGARRRCGRRDRAPSSARAARRRARRDARTAASSTRACRRELDELRDIAAGGRDRIAAIEARERERTGIPSLKVKFNSVFGYYIEVTRAHLASVPAEYRRKQTVANARALRDARAGRVRADRSCPPTNGASRSSSRSSRRCARDGRRGAPRTARARRRASPRSTRWRRWPRSRTVGLLPPRGRRRRRHRSRRRAPSGRRAAGRRPARSSPTTSRLDPAPSRS